MKRGSTPLLLGLALLFAFSSAGCGQTSASESSQKTLEIAADHTPLARALGLAASQSYLICDDRFNQLLIVTYDTEKQNPSEGGRDQANSTYYDRFVQYDLNTQLVLKTFPIEKFGFIASAAFAFDGFVYSYMAETEPETWDVALFYQPIEGEQAPRRVADIPTGTPFASGPTLSRCGENVVFGYGDYGDSFALNVLTPDFTVSPLLSFPWRTLEGTEWITDDFRTSDAHFAYPVGRDGQVVFYVGQMGQEPVQIALPKGEKLYAFDIADDQLLVSRTNQTAGGTFCIERLDLTGASLEVYETDMQYQGICLNDLSQFCVFGANLPLGVFAIVQNAIQPVDVDTTFLASTWNLVLSNGADFILASQSPNEYPDIWRISLKSSPAAPSPS
ncbi:MAG: hypothetical protein ACOX0U_05360 [Oscillospiraceae bacterium]|jgi:hypothetical protein